MKPELIDKPKISNYFLYRQGIPCLLSVADTGIY